jgi:leucyl aminopeptidase
MTSRFFLTDGPAGEATPITPIARDDLDGWLRARQPPAAAWVGSCRFTGEAGEICVIPDVAGGIERVLVGRGRPPSMWDWAAVPGGVREGLYAVDGALSPVEAEAAALAWALATYRFERYRTTSRGFPTLVRPHGADPAAVDRLAEAVFLVRDLINTPAQDLGPEELADAVGRVGDRWGARCRVVVGDDLIAQNYPAIHAVGRASSRPPRLIDLRWGDPGHPRLTLVGKGVCFDSGGLDIKPAAAMKLMKKDMGGAAIVLGLAQLVMSAGLPVRLRLLIPAVENSISGNALRPLDVVRTRGGLTVEIGNTDAEGRVILADALADAGDEEPALLIDCATLTGAARIALGTELPALFGNDDAVADALLAAGRAVEDPLWRLPLWQPYRRHIDGKIADLTNAPDHAFAGAITAALFLAAFVKANQPWLHIDVMAWNLDSRPGRPEGGEAAGLRALFALIVNRFGR